MTSDVEMPDAILSDESSFYGDDDTKAELENRVASHDGRADWLEFQTNSLAVVAHNALHPYGSQNVDKDRDISKLSRKQPHPHDGKEYCWQVAEPIDEFINRLRPSQADADTIGPWIRVRNPFFDENVDLPDRNVAAFMSRGRELLEDFEEQKSTMEAEYAKSRASSTAPLTRKLNVMRKELEKNLLATARKYGAVVGKWMFFEPPDRVDDYWATIAAATARGDLCIEAKVATDSNKRPSPAKRDRLICVYTRDCEDKDDVRHVMERLVELGLVRKGERPIYYKCDAWTYLDIKANNPWGLKASMYSSKDVLQGK
ncbi:hypothetical protein BGW36DRAFT_213481 [Talaromyces proteolyticus]|uniref:DUF1917-domain-containing protein n=1 Tax=Talaromyces proteolyticus TaxID=1131652 RepID=A0AAD4PVX1_9EURO|nr:uncharacterized protein BGW36DRAFT_213481 [Talaromyces proteolyticus]KAH8693967.1 hypothetical protein BGW36DRAFT_213481 [Talaromyces proteolyticus]